MMKLFVAIIFLVSATAGRLDNTYLPPGSAETAGGNVTVFQTPSKLLPSNHLATTVSSPTPIYTVPVATRIFGSISSPSVVYGSPLGSTRYAGVVPAPVTLSGVPLTPYSGLIYPPVPILRLNNEFNSDGSYRFDYETANHIAAQESGHQKTADTSEVQGSYSYLAPNGQTISLSYIADENGFRPTGDHLPTPPPIPAAILKSLEINAAEEARGIVDNGQYRPSAEGLVVVRPYSLPSVSSQYLPPVAQVGYKY